MFVEFCIFTVFKRYNKNFGRQMLMKLSLIVPCLNEEGNIINFQNTVIDAFSSCDYDYEIIFIDDGSNDNKERKCHIKVVSFSRNFGKESAIYAGLQYADGEYISLIDADLQQRPETVRDMVKILDEHSEFDVVAAYQDKRHENKIISFFKKSFYRIMDNLSNIKLKADASDFRTFRRCVAESILLLGEYHRFSKGIFSWVGYNTFFIPYVACERASGESKWGFRKLLNYAIDGIIDYSTKPLRIATAVGGIAGISALIYLLVVIIQKITVGIPIPGYATIIILILLLGAAQLFCIGIIGEYVGRAFEQSKNRPIYIAKQVLDYTKE